MSVNHMSLYAYIMSMVGNSHDADDIMQNTSVLMWERFSEFKKGTDFVAWGIRIAFYKIKEFRAHNNRYQFDDDVFEQLHTKARANLTNANLYADKLNLCLAKLPSSDASLLRLRYGCDYSIKWISQRTNVSVQAVYMKLSKIHDMLGRCIKRLMAEESIG